MAAMAAQVSLYPLGKPDLHGPIDSALRTLAERGVTVRPGAMSSIVVGESATVFAALGTAYAEAAARGPVVMVVTFSNACPVETTEATAG